MCVWGGGGGVGDGFEGGGGLLPITPTLRIAYRFISNLSQLGPGVDSRALDF